jgi:thiamine pyrophosphokinase
MTKNNDWALIANGEKLSSQRLHEITKNRQIIACDGGIHNCLAEGIIPQILLGDLDSVDPALLQQLESQDCEIISAKDQNKTDSEKALLYLINNGCESVVITQAIGDRIDHSLTNLKLLSQYRSKKYRLSMAREKENIFFAQDETVIIRGEPGSHIGIMGFTEATITTTGLKYECDQLKISLQGASSACNSLVGNQAIIEVLGNALLSQSATIRT